MENKSQNLTIKQTAEELEKALKGKAAFYDKIGATEENVALIISALTAERYLLDNEEWDDKELAEDSEIENVHPTKTGDHKTYEEAMRLVGARRSKHGLCELVNWLLVRILTERVKALEEANELLGDALACLNGETPEDMSKAAARRLVMERIEMFLRYGALAQKEPNR